MASATNSRFDSLQLVLRLVILALAGLLIVYHTYTLFDLYISPGSSTHTGFEYLQSALRAAIVISLSCVLLGVRGSLWLMWLCIGSLVGTQLWAHLTDFQVDFTEGRHPLSYFMGFLFPTLITLATIGIRRRKAQIAAPEHVG